MRKLTYFLIGMGTVWGSHATKLESMDFTVMQVVNIIVASVLGGLVALRALLDGKGKI